jgi:hypothetical protein
VRQAARRVRSPSPCPACPVGEGPPSPFSTCLAVPCLVTNAARRREPLECGGRAPTGRQHRFGSNTGELPRASAIQSGVGAASRLCRRTPYGPAFDDDGCRGLRSPAPNGAGRNVATTSSIHMGGKFPFPRERRGCFAQRASQTTAPMTNRPRAEIRNPQSAIDPPKLQRRRVTSASASCTCRACAQSCRSVPPPTTPRSP